MIIKHVPIIKCKLNSRVPLNKSSTTAFSRIFKWSLKRKHTENKIKRRNKKKFCCTTIYRRWIAHSSIWWRIWSAPSSSECSGNYSIWFNSLRISTANKSSSISWASIRSSRPIINSECNNSWCPYCFPEKKKNC